MEINIHTRTTEILRQYPECHEFLYPFHQQCTEMTTLASLAGDANLSVASLVAGLERYVKRSKQSPCDYAKMRSRLVVPGAVNVAGFVHFLCHEPLVHELSARAKELKVNLNIHLFPKHLKKEFQSYLSLCNSADDLPEILIGKGFSSLLTSRFIDKFVRSGHFRHEIPGISMGNAFLSAGFSDPENDFHPFGVEEMVMVYDKTFGHTVDMPGSWDDLLMPEYNGMLCQMGKDRRDHFGFEVLLYLFARYGLQGIRSYAANVKVTQHFTNTVKNFGSKNASSVPVNIMHQFAVGLIRSNAKEVAEVVHAKEENPGVCHYFLLKKEANGKALELARHLYAPAIRAVIEKSGISHITSDQPLSGNATIRWIGWNWLRMFPMPYLKEHLAEIAYEHYKN